jgi:hypothetical protein
MGNKYSMEDLERAVSAVKGGGISTREAERVYSVPFDTIGRRANGSVDMDCQRPGPTPALGVESEKELKMAVFWVVAPYSPVDVCQRFRGPCCLHHKGDE